jgi:hypothetical protein
MGDGYTKENKLSTRPGPSINDSAMFDAAMTLLKFHRRFIICRPKLRFDVRNRAELFVKVNEMNARESLPCSQTMTWSLDIKAIVHPKTKILSSFTHPRVVPNP